MKCDDIQKLLFDYMTRELGESRSALVREHIRMCEKCKAEAMEIQSTLDLLQEDSKAGNVPDHLSEDRRKRIIRAFMHPFMNWVERHHVIISIIIALIVILVLAFATPKINIFKKPDSFDGITVNVMPHEKSGRLEKIEKPK